MVLVLDLKHGDTESTESRFHGESLCSPCLCVSDILVNPASRSKTSAIRLAPPTLDLSRNNFPKVARPSRPCFTQDPHGQDAHATSSAIKSGGLQSGSCFRTNPQFLDRLPAKPAQPQLRPSTSQPLRYFFVSIRAAFGWPVSFMLGASQVSFVSGSLIAIVPSRIVSVRFPA